jgi:hypothetical protein
MFSEQIRDRNGANGNETKNGQTLNIQNDLHTLPYQEISGVHSIKYHECRVDVQSPKPSPVNGKSANVERALNDRRWPNSVSAYPNGESTGKTS